MWQVAYFIAVQRELQVQRELELRRRLAQGSQPTGRERVGFVRRVLALGAGIVDTFFRALDRPRLDSHHL